MNTQTAAASYTSRQWPWDLKRPAQSGGIQLPKEVSHVQQCERQQTWVMILTVTRTQCRSMGSPPGFTPPSISASRLMLLTRRMLMSFSQQKAWIKVKWIWRATSSSSSEASRHNTTLSGSLEATTQRQMSEKGDLFHATLLDLRGSHGFYLHIKWLCCFVDSDSDATLRQCCVQDLLQSFSHRVHPERRKYPHFH